MTQPVVPSLDLPERLDLPSGGWVTFNSPEDLTGADHRRVMASLGDLGNNIDAAMALAEGAACALIREWSIPYTPRGTDYPPGEVPTPTAAGNWPLVEALRLPDYHRIIATVGPVATILFPADPSPDQAGTPGSPTVPAGG